MSKIRVVGAVVTTQQLTLYQENGEVIRMSQGDPRVKPIIDKITPLISKGLTAEVDISTPEDTSYREFEEKSSGAIKLFRVAKKWVRNVFKSQEEKEQEAALVPETTLGAVPTDSKLGNAISQIMENARPIASNEAAPTTVNDETVIAVVEGKVIPGVEQLAGQFKHSSKFNNTIGLENFLKRISKVIDKRGHSVEDLLRFMEKGDLPLADDGSIIVYKILQSRSKSGKPEEKGLFYDCHSGNVPQRVGSYVHVDISLVDTNRRNECSNGLHVARRGYLGNFYGDTCVLAKLAPEDVVTVPHNDPNKIRVMGYHILGVIRNEDFLKLKSNSPMTDSAPAKVLLANAIKGNHVGVLERVKIGASYGGKIEITKTDEESVQRKTPTKVVTKATNAMALDDKEISADNLVDPKALSKTVAEVKQTKPLSKREQARTLYNAKQFNELKLLKKSAKTGWDKLGLSPEEVRAIESNEPVKLSESPVRDEPAESAPAKLVKKAKAKKVAPKATPKPAPPVDVMPDGYTKAQQARWYYQRKRWSDLNNLKRKAKVSWKALGFTGIEEAVIKQFI